MNVVFDTNVIVSAMGWGGKPAEALFLCLEDDRYSFVTSEALLRELARVLEYPKLVEKISDERKYLILASLSKVALLVDPEIELDVIAVDPPDNRVLECAVAGAASFVISGDEHLLKLGVFEDSRIVTPEDFLVATKSGVAQPAPGPIEGGR